VTLDGAQIPWAIGWVPMRILPMTWDATWDDYGTESGTVRTGQLSQLSPGGEYWCQPGRIQHSCNVGDLALGKDCDNELMMWPASRSAQKEENVRQKYMMDGGDDAVDHRRSCHIYRKMLSSECNGSGLNVGDIHPELWWYNTATLHQ